MTSLATICSVGDLSINRYYDAAQSIIIIIIIISYEMSEHCFFLSDCVGLHCMRLRN